MGINDVPQCCAITILIELYRVSTYISGKGAISEFAKCKFAVNYAFIK